MAAPNPASASVSDDWQIDEGDTRPASLIVQLRRSAYVFPWFRFVCVSGDNETLRIVFVSHSITVCGYGLLHLLAALSTHRVLRIIQPSQNDAKFEIRASGQAKTVGIDDIVVESAEEQKQQ